MSDCAIAGPTWEQELRLLLAREIDPVSVEILALQAVRVRDGRRTYGDMQPDDKRNFLREALEEVLDALYYVAAKLVKLLAIVGLRREGKA